MLHKILISTSLILGVGAWLAAPLALAGPEGQPGQDDQTQASDHIVTSEVHFDFDSADLSDSGRAALDVAASWIATKKAGAILIEGHADKVGRPPYNKQLAERRAQAARAYLLARGVPADRIRVLSYGEGLPIIDTPKRSRENRRIVLTAVEKEPIVERTVRTEVMRVPVPQKIYVDRVVRVPVARPARRPLGFAVLAGGGVTGFIDDHTRDVTDVGGTWTAGVVGRTGELVGFEAAYIGSAQDIDILGMDANATVVGNGLEGSVRLNLIPGARVTPFLFAGLGWSHYSITNTDVTTAAVDDQDDVLHIPAGAGLSVLLRERLFLDLRGTYRGAFGDGMFHGGEEANDGLESWAAAARLGLSF